jgi:hypothetical protein
MDKRKQSRRLEHLKREREQHDQSNCDTTYRDDTQSDDGCPKKCSCTLEKKESCNACCNEFSTALGNIIENSAAEIQAQMLAAIARGLPPDAATARLLIFQDVFYTPFLNIIRDAFLNPGKISSRCCAGYANGVAGAAAGILSLALFNAFNPLIPTGDPINPAPQPGTVVQNLRMSLAELVTTIDALKRINRKCECQRRC